MSKRKPVGRTKRPGAVVQPRRGAESGLPARGATGGSAETELDLVRDLARIATEFDLTEIELGPAGHIRVSRQALVAPAAPAPAVTVSAPAATPLSVVPNPGSAEENASFIMSPFVGTFYRAPSPERPSFVEVGQSIRKGQIVCIVEAMKLMNEIESEVDGNIAEVLVENGEHVEYGQKLFRVS